MKKRYTTPRAVYVNFDYEEQVVARSIPSTCGVHGYVYNAVAGSCPVQEMAAMSAKSIVWDKMCTFYNEEIPT